MMSSIPSLYSSTSALSIVHLHQLFYFINPCHRHRSRLQMTSPAPPFLAHPPPPPSCQPQYTLHGYPDTAMPPPSPQIPTPSATRPATSYLLHTGSPPPPGPSPTPIVPPPQPQHSSNTSISPHYSHHPPQPPLPSTQPFLQHEAQSNANVYQLENTVQYQKKPDVSDAQVISQRQQQLVPSSPDVSLHRHPQSTSANLNPHCFTQYQQHHFVSSPYMIQQNEAQHYPVASNHQSFISHHQQPTASSSPSTPQNAQHPDASNAHMQIPPRVQPGFHAVQTPTPYFQQPTTSVSPGHMPAMQSQQQQQQVQTHHPSISTSQLCTPHTAQPHHVTGAHSCGGHSAPQLHVPQQMIGPYFTHPQEVLQPLQQPQYIVEGGMYAVEAGEKKKKREYLMQAAKVGIKVAKVASHFL